MTSAMEYSAQSLDRLDQQYFGKYRGTVVDNVDPLKIGRLKVRIPSLFTDDPTGTQSDDCVTDWAMPCVPFGGANEQGFFMIPEKEANVWMEFEEGHLDKPIWVGTFWIAPSGTAQTPTEAQDGSEPHHHVIKTVGGHVIDLSDVDGSETINIKHTSGAIINLDAKGSIAIINQNGSNLYLNADDGEAALIDENGNNLSMKSSGITLTNKDGAFIDLSGDSISLSAGSILLRGQTVSLGEGALEPAILGIHFATMYDAHTHPTALGPTGPPIPAPMPLSVPTNQAISQSVKVK